MMITDAAAKAPINVLPLRGGISALEGSGGNVAVSVGPDGKVMVDAGIAVSRRQMAEALASLGPQPITQLINTHWHFDHANGNEWLHEETPSILAHENTRRHLSTLTRVDDWDYDFQPLAAAAVPGLVMTGAYQLRLNGTIDLKHYPAAHTDGDIAVTFAEQDIVHTGDLYWSAGYPFIDRSTGGSIDGKIAAVGAILDRITGATIVIPGHGPISDKAGLSDYYTMLRTIREKVAASKYKGLTEEKTIAVGPTGAFDAVWGKFVIDPAFFVRLVYPDV